MILAKGGHFCLIQVGLLLWDMILSLWSCDHFSLFVYAFSCFTASLSWLAVGKLLPVWAPCVPPHTWLSSLSFWKGTEGCTLTSYSHELLNRILVHPQQNGCWTLTKCSPGAVKPWKPDLAVWSVSQALSFHGWLFIYFFPLPLRICGGSRSFLSADYHWHCRRSSPGRRHWKGMALY